MYFTLEIKPEGSGTPSECFHIREPYPGVSRRKASPLDPWLIAFVLSGRLTAFMSGTHVKRSKKEKGDNKRYPTMQGDHEHCTSIKYDDQIREALERMK